MDHKTERTLPVEAKPDAAILLAVAAKIPLEKQAGFLEFLRGVGYGLELADKYHQPEAPQAGT